MVGDDLDATEVDQLEGAASMAEWKRGGASSCSFVGGPRAGAPLASARVALHSLRVAPQEADLAPSGSIAYCSSNEGGEVKIKGD
jgi:hypothetical protein